MVFSPHYSQIDFGSAKESTWSALNDGVMGGRSSGKVTYSTDALQFSGNVSLENNGGFASVRSTYGRYDLSSYQLIKVTYRSAGQSLGMVMENDPRWFLPNYKAILPETNGEWQSITIEIGSFKEFRIGRPTGNSLPDAQRAKIIRIGFITNDKKEGPFSAEIDQIEFIP
jgi:hypothetical protein